MDKSNKNKADFLGMSFGKAQHRLRVNLMFKLAQQCGMDICFRCGERIEKPEDLGIDHKKSWLYVSLDLFWDLENVAFSHRACNVTDRPMWPKKYLPKEGEAWCTCCRRFKSKAEFGLRKNTGSGVRNVCNLCRKAQDWGHGKRRFRTSKYLINMNDVKEATAFARLRNGESLRDVARSYNVNHETLRRRFYQNSGISV